MTISFSSLVAKLKEPGARASAFLQVHNKLNLRTASQRPAASADQRAEVMANHPQIQQLAVSRVKAGGHPSRHRPVTDGQGRGEVRQGDRTQNDIHGAEIIHCVLGEPLRIRSRDRHGAEEAEGLGAKIRIRVQIKSYLLRHEDQGGPALNRCSLLVERRERLKRAAGGSCTVDDIQSRLLVALKNG